MHSTGGSSRAATRIEMVAVPFVAVALALVGPLGRWLAVALLLAAGPTLLAPLRSHPSYARWTEALHRHGPRLLLLGVAALLLWPLALGRPPASRDHGIHYFQTQILVDDLLPRGSVRGWSQRLNAGYPYGDSYPVLGYLVTGAANLLSFGLVSLRTSYAWGILAVWAITLWAVARLARDTLRPTTPSASARLGSIDPRWAGAFAACLWLLDPGSSRQGGWNYLMFHGVWPQLLSTSLWIGGVVLAHHALSKPNTRTVGAAALLLGSSVLAHPFAMITGATSAGVGLVALWATGAGDRRPPGWVRLWLGMHGLAALVCAGWVLSFLASAEWMARSPVPWQPLDALAAQTVTGELFARGRAWVGPLAVVGLVLLARRRGAVAWTVLGTFAALAILASDAAVTVLRLDLIVPGFKNMQFPRYAIALKPLWYALAGVGAAALLGWARRRPPDANATSSVEDGTPTVLGARKLRWVACLAAAPFVLALVEVPGAVAPRPVGGIATLEGSVHAEDEAALRDLLKSEADALGDRRMRVAFLRGKMGGTTYPLFALTDLRADVVLDGHIPAVNYRLRVARRTPEALRALGVTHVLRDREIPAAEERLGRGLLPVAQVGPWTLERLAGAERYRELSPSARSPRGGTATMQARTPEEITLTWDGEADAEVTLSLAPYRKWHAHGNDGAELEWFIESRYGGTPAMRIVDAPPGTIKLAYRTPRRERIAGWVSLGAIFVVLLGLALGRPITLAERLHAPAARRLSLGLGLASAALVAMLVMQRQAQRLEATWAPVLEATLGAGYEFEADLTTDASWHVSSSNPRGCDAVQGKDALAGCVPARERAHVSMGYRAPFLYRCVKIMIPGHGRTRVKFELEGTASVVGFAQRMETGKQDLRMFINDQVQPGSVRRVGKEFSVADGRDELHVVLENPEPRAAHACVAAAAVQATR